MPAKVTIQWRRDTEANWAGKTLANGEAGVTTDGDNKGRFKLGDGATVWGDLPYQGNAGTSAPLTSTSGVIGLDYGTGLKVSGGALVPDFGTTSSKPLAGNHAGTITGVHGVTGNVVGTSDVQSITNKTIVNQKTSVNIVASAATGTINVDVETADTWFYNVNASANYTLNFRASSGTALNTRLSVGESQRVTFRHKNGTTAYFPSAFQIDGTPLTSGSAINWEKGAIPSAPNANSFSEYTFDILKTAANTYTVTASEKNYALATSGGQQLYTVTGTSDTSYSFTVPATVTSISAVVIGGGGGSYVYNNADEAHGGGGGGGLAYGNNIAVTPGETLTIQVGAGGIQGTGESSAAGDGGTSFIKRSATVLLQATGGAAADEDGTAVAPGGTGSGTVMTAGYSGGNGGSGSGHINAGGGGGGGAAGYVGNGGAGADYSTTSTGKSGSSAVSGSGGAGGGGGGGWSSGSAVGQPGAGGGGTGVLGLSNTGSGGSAGVGGGGGSGGGVGFYTTNGSRNGGSYGGGAGGQGRNTTTMTLTTVGGHGAVRII